MYSWDASWVTWFFLNIFHQVTYSLMAFLAQCSLFVLICRKIHITHSLFIRTSNLKYEWAIACFYLMLATYSTPQHTHRQTDTDTHTHHFRWFPVTLGIGIILNRRYRMQNVLLILRSFLIVDDSWWPVTFLRVDAGCIAFWGCYRSFFFIDVM